MFFPSLSILWLVAPFILGGLWLSERSNRKIDARKYYDQGYADGYIAANAVSVSQPHTPAPVQPEPSSVAVATEPIAQQSVHVEDDAQAASDVANKPVESRQTLETEQPVFGWTSAPTPRSTTSTTPVASPAPVDPEKRKLQNLNTMLYMASFLLVAAAATFIAAAMPAGVRFGVLVIVVTLFYIGGIILYKTSERLRPAAMAFVGTGLAVLPFIGVAMTMLIDVPASTAWLTVSFIGLGAYIYAAIVLQNQTVSYLSMAFVLSTVSSAVSVASLPIVWYFIGLIAVALLASSISYIQPKLLPKVFHQPLEMTGQIVTPVTLVASLIVIDKMSIRMYELVFGLASAQYLLTWLQQRSRLYETICRVLVHITALIVAWDIAQMSYETRSTLLFGVLWITCAGGQMIVSLVKASHKSDAERRQVEKAWLVIGQGMLYGAMLLWFASFGQAYSAALTVIALLVGAVLAVATTARYRDMIWTYISLANTWLLVMAVCRWLVEPNISWEIVMVAYACLAVIATGLYWRYRASYLAMTELATSGLVVFGGGVLLASLLSGDMITIGWAAAIIDVLAIVYSHVSRVVSTEILGAGFGVAAIWLWMSQVSLIDASWRSTTAIVTALCLLAAAATGYHFSKIWLRRNGMLCVGIGVSLLLIVNFVNGDELVRQVSTALLLLFGIGTFGLRWRMREKSELQQLFTIGYFVQIAFAWCLTLTVPTVWSVVCYVVAVALLFAASYVEKAPGLTIGGLALIPVTVYTAWQWLEFSGEWLIVGVAAISTAIFYALYWVFVWVRDEWREQVAVGGVWLLALLAFLIQFFAIDSAQVVAGCLILLFGAATMGIHAYRKRDILLGEIAVYVASVALQKIINVLVPEANYVFYAHWWAVTIVLVVLWRRHMSRPVSYRPALAMGIISFCVGVAALSEGGMYQLLFLVEHIGLLVAGALLRRQWAVWWGVIGAVAAVLYFIKDFVYLWLALLGIGLIALVIWQLVRMSKKDTGKHE